MGILGFSERDMLDDAQEALNEARPFVEALKEYDDYFNLCAKYLPKSHRYSEEQLSYFRNRNAIPTELRELQKYLNDASHQLKLFNRIFDATNPGLQESTQNVNQIMDTLSALSQPKAFEDSLINLANAVFNNAKISALQKIRFIQDLLLNKKGAQVLKEIFPDTTLDATSQEQLAFTLLLKKKISYYECSALSTDGNWRIKVKDFARQHGIIKSNAATITQKDTGSTMSTRRLSKLSYKDKNAEESYRKICGIPNASPSPLEALRENNDSHERTTNESFSLLRWIKKLLIGVAEKVGRVFANTSAAA